MELLKIKGLKKNYINEKQVICALKSINLKNHIILEKRGK